MSDAQSIAPLNSFKKHQQRLARYQRRMSHKVKFSCNWKKAKAKVQKVHTDIASFKINTRSLGSVYNSNLNKKISASGFFYTGG